MGRILRWTFLLIAIAVPAWAQAPYDNSQTPEGWAWAQINTGRAADFNRRPECGGKSLDPHEQAGWDNDCRQISPQFLIDILTVPKWRDQIRQSRVDLVGARITGDLDLAMTEIATALVLAASRIEGDLDLIDARLKRLVSLNGSVITGAVSAYRMHAESSFGMGGHAAFNGAVNLTGAMVDGDLNMSTASFASDVGLRGAKVGGNLEMSTSSFHAMQAGGLEVHGDLFMDDHATFAGDVGLRGAKIGGQLAMNTSSFHTVRADRLDVHGDLFMRDYATFGGDVGLVGAKIGGLLDLRSATATSLDLSGLVGGELQLGGLGWQCRGTPTKSEPSDRQETRAKETSQHWPLGSPGWRKACNGTPDSQPGLILRNAHVEVLQDSADAWPPVLDLEGFRYDRLGGIQGTGRDDMRARSPEDWSDWLAHDRTFSPQPYTQLAGVLVGAGRRDTAESILFAGRERERDEILTRTDIGSWQWWSHDATHWIWLTLFSGLAGYGIGLYTFRVLWWVVLLTVLGAAVLHYSPYAQRRRVLWRFGASLHRLLPIVELNKEFKDFFDTTTLQPGEPVRLYRWQMVFFAGVAMAGWVLSFFLLAAMGGLTPK